MPMFKHIASIRSTCAGLFIVLGAFGLAAQSMADDTHASAGAPATSLRSVLSPEEFRRAGLDKLTEDELAFLSDRLLHATPETAPVGPDPAVGPEPMPLESRRPAQAPVADPRPGAAPGATGPTVATDTTPRIQGEAAFGREEELRREEERAQRVPKTIESRIAGTFRGWSGRTVFQLENGQVWQQVEDSTFSVNLENPRVTLEKGAMGAFYLRVESYGSRVKVRRIK